VWLAGVSATCSARCAGPATIVATLVSAPHFGAEVDAIASQARQRAFTSRVVLDQNSTIELASLSATRPLHPSVQ